MQQEEKQTIQSIIAQVIKINEKYEEIKKIKGDNFNIFSILKLERNEVKTHSNFIYELLNPKGSHNQETLFLELFLENILRLEDYGDIKNVYQEYSTSENRRIDFVIETKNYQIGIEMKIDAADQANQLLDYKNELDKAKKKSRLYYLTLTGYEASEESTNNELKVNNDYFLLSFKDNIYNWVENCIEKSVSTPILREGLEHYKNLIGKITNKISTPMEKDMEELIKMPKDVKAVQTLLDTYPKIWAKKEMIFWNELEDNLKVFYKSKNYDFFDNYELWNDEKDKEKTIESIFKRRNTYGTNNIAGFGLWKQYHNKTSVYIVICQTLDNICIYLSFWNKDEDMIMNPNLDAICKEIGFSKIYNKHERYKVIDEKITFYGLYQTEPTYDLFDSERFQYYIGAVAKEVQSRIILLEENENSIIEAIIS